MALLRAIQRQCLQKTLFNNNSIPRASGALVCKGKSYSDTQGKAHADMKEFWVKNENMSRPQSPHLTVWKWELPMNTSLMHRITGSAMTTVLYAFGYTICMLPGDYSFYLNMIHDAHLGPAMILCAKFALAYPLAYHAINAGRHLGWDAGKGFDMATIYKTGWFAVFGGAVLAGLITQL